MANVTSLNWSVEIVKQMFPAQASPNIHEYFPRIERRFESVFGHIHTVNDAPLSFAPGADAKNVDLMRLKVYTYASVRAECDDFLPRDEGMWTENRKGVKGNTNGLKKGAKSKFIPIWADELHPQSHPAMVRDTAAMDYSDESLFGMNTLPRMSVVVPAFGNNKDPNRPYGRYDNRKMNRIEGVKDANGLGQLYRGRGFIQLTGLSNYTTIGKHIGVDLVFSPYRALQPMVAVAVLVAYMELSKDKIIHALSKNDFTAARRAVNGGTNGLKESTDAYRIGFDKAKPFADGS